MLSASGLRKDEQRRSCCIRVSTIQFPRIPNPSWRLCVPSGQSSGKTNALEFTQFGATLADCLWHSMSRQDAASDAASSVGGASDAGSEAEKSDAGSQGGDQAADILKESKFSLKVRLFNLRS